MEEELKILEALVKGIYKYGFDYDVDGEKHDILRYEEFKALENLLTRYKQLEEENKEIKKEFALNTEIHKRDEIIKDLKETINCLHETDKENYIPKSKIKEKIEELNDYYKKEIYPTKYQWADIDITEFYDSQIELLQELLEEE